MIVELNKIYIFSAPDKASGLISDDDDAIVKSTSSDIWYSHLKKLNNSAQQDVTITSYSKVFMLKDKLMQAVIFVNDYPEKMAKKRVKETVAKYTKKG